MRTKTEQKILNKLFESDTNFYIHGKREYNAAEKLEKQGFVFLHRIDGFYRVELTSIGRSERAVREKIEEMYPAIEVG